MSKVTVQRMWRSTKDAATEYFPDATVSVVSSGVFAVNDTTDGSVWYYPAEVIDFIIERD